MSLIAANGNVVETVAPIPMEKLKLYFEDKNTKFLISYKDSALKESKLLIYLSNLDIPCDLDMSGCSNEEFSALMTEYLNSPFLVKLDCLIKHVVNLMFYKNKMFNPKNIILDIYEEFISKNTEILEKWEKLLDSCLLYNFYILDDAEMQEYAKSHEQATEQDEDLRGINFVHLFDYQEFYYFYQRNSPQTFRYYNKYFNEYIFKGKNLYYYWSNVKNPYFLITAGLATGRIKGEDYLQAKIETLKLIAKKFNIDTSELESSGPTSTP